MNAPSPVEGFVAVGSNISPERNVMSALKLLLAQVKVAASSTFYRTLPIGRPEQDPYLNGIWEIVTDRSPMDLKFSVLRDIEARLGRERTGDRYAARPIDLDLVLYGAEEIRTGRLILPDPDIEKRPFVGIPLFDLAGDRLLPGTGRSLAEVVQRFDDSGMEPMESFSMELRKRIAKWM